MNAQCNIPDVDRYRLRPLRELRDRDERTKRSDLAAAVGDARVTAADVAAAHGLVTAARSALAAAITTRDTVLVGPAARLALAARYIARRRRDLDAALGAHARTRAAHDGRLGAVDGARDRLTAARADKQLIERHFARWRADRAKLAERRED